MRKKILRISLIIGLLLFALLVYKIGPDQIWEHMKKLTWQSFLILFFLRFLFWILRTISWKIVIEQYESKVPFAHLFTAIMAGHGISYLTPSLQLGGEPIRAMMVSSSNKRKNLASVIVDKTIEIIIMIFFITIGIAIAITQVPLPRRYKYIFAAFVLVSLLLAIIIFVKQKQGFFIWIVNMLEKIKIKPKFVERNRAKIRETDEYISNFYRNHKKVFLIVILLNLFIFLFWTAEIYLALLFIGAKGTTFLNSFLILTLGSIVILLPTIPASLGTYEVTYVAIFILLGLGADVGITLTLIRRILALTGAGAGLLAMLRSQVRDKS